ncbi:hypothetical protein MVEN_00470500 [Mycena venus]|uniref:Uncharacterized protein n=1 Tax=Mycena venus TaxID=2733690 RepID=A0A8H7DBV3_9AGAR|nr:hypothetical protein MVEN_00470500 [Mycena venus]
MSETPSHSINSGLALSAAPPFLLSLPSQGSDPSLRPDFVHEQKGLSAAQVAGLKSVQGTLSSHHGGISSGAQSAIPEGAKPVFGDGSGLPLGPPSNTRRITRSSTLPSGVTGPAPAPVDGPVTASVDSESVDPDHPTNVQATADSDRPPSPSNVTTFAHFGLNTGPKSETGGSTIKRTTKNLEILADVARTTETQVNKLALDLDKLTVEVRLNNAPFSFQDQPRDDGSTRDDIEELFDRVRDLERFESAASSGTEDFSIRLSALEDRVPGAGGQITTALTTALASRFHDITSDRDKLNNEIRFQAEKQAKATAKLQRAHDDLQRTLSELQDTITRLELGNPAPPLRIPIRSLGRRGGEQPLTSSTSNTHLSRHRSRSPPMGTSVAKRPKVQGFLTMGPLPSSPLSPRDFFKSLIAESLPTFNLSTYEAILDPVYPYHLRITLDSSIDVKALISMWETGSRTIRMQEMPSAGSPADSVSAPPSRDRLNDQRNAYNLRGQRS